MGTCTFVQAIAAGNALRLHLVLPNDALFCRVLRRSSDNFTGPNDQGAFVVADGCTDSVVLDTTALVNGTPYYYRVYCNFPGNAWDAPPTVTGIPATSYVDGGSDPQEIVRSRLAAGLAAEVVRGTLTPNSGAIPVVDSPYALADRITFPMVTVHVDQTAPAERALGEDVVFAGMGDDEGYLARTTLNIAAVSLNPDERGALRQALQRILLANLTVFADFGMLTPQWSFADSEQLTDREGAATMFMTGGSFVCVHPVFVLTEPYPALVDVQVTCNSMMEPVNG